MTQQIAEPADTLPAQRNSATPTREQIARLEAQMRDMPQVHIEPVHTFGPGFYARTIHIPAGSTLTGKVHATEHIFLLTAGEMLLATEDGSQRVSAPFQCVARPGLKRVGYAITDCSVTNVHITPETDLLKLEAQLIEAESPDALTRGEEAAALEH